jgi:hypothetical protein
MVGRGRRGVEGVGDIVYLYSDRQVVLKEKGSAILISYLLNFEECALNEILCRSIYIFVALISSNILLKLHD